MDQKVKHNGEFTDTGVPNAQPQKVGSLRLGDVVLQPGATAVIPNWQRVSRSNAVATWLRVGIIETVGAPVEDASDDDNGNDSEAAAKADLIAKLAARGINKTARTTLENLQKALDESEPKSVVNLPGLTPTA